METGAAQSVHSLNDTSWSSPSLRLPATAFAEQKLPAVSTHCAVMQEKPCHPCLIGC